MTVFYTHLRVFGDVDDLSISDKKITAGSNITVYCSKNVLEIHGEILVDQPSTKKICHLPAGSVISIFDIFAQGNIVITNVDMEAINRNAFPLIMTLCDGAKLRSGLATTHLFCKLETGASIDTFKRHAGVSHRWSVADLEVYMQPGCSVQGLSVLDSAKFVMTAPATMSSRPTVGDIVIKPSTSLKCLPRESFREKAPNFNIVRESTASTSQIKLVASEECTPQFKTRIESVILRCIAAEEAAHIASSAGFYRVTYRHKGNTYSITTSGMPDQLPEGAVISDIMPLGSGPRMSFSTCNSVPLPPPRKRPVPEYRLEVEGAALQRILDESREISELDTGEQLDLTSSFQPPEDFMNRHDPFFVVEGNVSAEDTKQDAKEGRCVMCLENAAIVVFHDCYHRAMCLACAQASKFLTDTCPICKAEIKKAIVPF